VTGYPWQILLMNGIMILLLTVMIIYLMFQSRVVDLEKKFEKFALLSVHDSEKSFFDVVIKSFWLFIHKMSKFLSNNKMISNYAKRYEKHIKYENRNDYSGMDYVSVKFFLALSFVLLYFITSFFHLNKVHFINIIIGFVIGFFLPDIFLQVEYQKRRKRVEEDLLKAIIMMNNAFKSGRNIMQAVEIVMMELEGPISDEFKKIYLDMTYGLSIEVVFDRFYHRVELEEAKYITSSLSLLSKTGGNIVKVFGSIERNFFDKKKLKQEMQSLTSASIFVFRVLCVIPFLFILVIYILNPNYFTPMFETALGRILLLLVVLLYTLYILVIKKVLEVKL